MIEAIAPEVIAVGVVNLVALAAGYGRLQSGVRGLRNDVDKLDKAIHNGLSNKIGTICEDVAGIKATCIERAREVCE